MVSCNGNVGRQRVMTIAVLEHLVSQANDDGEEVEKAEAVQVRGRFHDVPVGNEELATRSGRGRRRGLGSAMVMRPIGRVAHGGDENLNLTGIENVGTRATMESRRRRKRALL
jgi:hypothetical protein